MSLTRKERRLADKQARKIGQTEVSARFKFREVENAISTATQYRDGGKYDQALALCQRSLDLEPDNPAIHFVAATVHEAKHDWLAAIESYQRALDLDPDFVAALCNCATCHAELLHYPQALELLQQARHRNRRLLVIDKLMGDIHVATKRFAEAIPHYRRVLSNKVTLAGLNALATAYDHSGDARRAIETYSTSLRNGAPPEMVYTNIATVHRTRGDFDQARQALNKALKADPGYPPALQMWASDATDDELAQCLTQTETALERQLANAPDGANAASLHFGMFHILDRLGRSDQAFGHLERANGVAVGEPGKAQENLRALVESIKSVYTREFIAEQSRDADDTNRPVFVFGMPRSGTTLVEQIIANQPGFRSVGELDGLNWSLSLLLEPTRKRFDAVAECYRQAAEMNRPDADRIIDKSLGHYLLVGPILCMFPRARFVFCHRHPVAIAASIYSLPFDLVAMPFAGSLPAIAEQFRIVDVMMQHWHKVAPKPILDVYYEDLINDPAAGTRAIMEYLGVSGDLAELEFRGSQDTVRTASLKQVRTSIYSTSLKRWDKYRPHLEPLETLLADEIAAYEQRALEGHNRE